eukprot:6984925-Prymnesium_polylepis.1
MLDYRAGRLHPQPTSDTDDDLSGTTPTLRAHRRACAAAALMTPPPQTHHCARISVATHTCAAYAH